jgi:hypothetical protein
MKNFVSLRTLAAAAVVLGTMGLAASAHARDNVQLHIGLGGPVYVQPAPVYVQPRPYYVQPATVYVQPAPVYSYGGGAWGDRDRDGVPNIYDRYDNRRHNHHNRGYGDADRDGVPNRYDRAPHNPYYR